MLKLNRLNLDNLSRTRRSYCTNVHSFMAVAQNTEFEISGTFSHVNAGL